MMKIINYIILSVLVILFACSPDEMPTDKEEKGNVTLLIKAGSETSTKTTLGSSANLQHVEKVFLYVFSGTNDAAIYMLTKEIPWSAPGEVSFHPTSRTYSINLAPGNYTFLAVGLDDKSGTTYNLPGIITTGITLSAAKARLASGKTKTDIASSELFAGYVIAPDVQKNGNAEITINLLRRVSGIIGWFSNVPYKLPDLTNGTIVSKMTVELFANQYKSIALKKTVASDYGEIPFSDNENRMNNKVVLEYDLTGYTQTAGKNYYNVTAVNTQNILQAGSYLLPIKAPASAMATLTLRFYDKTGTEISGTSRSVKLVSSTSDGGITSTADTITFSIEANQLYSLGTNVAPINLDPGVIDDIVIAVNPWWEGAGGNIPLE